MIGKHGIVFGRGVRACWLALMATLSAAAMASSPPLMVPADFTGSVQQSEIDSFAAYIQTLTPAPNNIGNNWAQGDSGEEVKAMGLVFEISHDTAILDRMLVFCDAVLSERDDLAPSPVGQYVLWTGRIDPAWPNEVTTTPIPTGGEQGDPTGHLGNCALQILQTPALWAKKVPDGDPNHYGKTYKQRAITYVQGGDAAWDGHILESLLDLSDNNLYTFSSADPYMPGQPVPWNQQMMFNYGLQYLAKCHAILGDDPARVTQYNTIMQANINSFFATGVTAYTDSKGRPAYNWAYALPATGGEDSNHGSLDVAGFARAYAIGGYGLTTDEMTRFADTFVDVMTLGPQDYAGRVDGTNGTGHGAPTTYIRSGYLLLAQFRPDAYLSMMSADLAPGVGTTATDQFSRYLWVKNQLYPAGASNLALTGTATASSEYSSSYPASLALDGNPGTRWASAAVSGQWWQVDLGASKTVQELMLYEYQSRATSYSVLVSNNGKSWKTVYSGSKPSSQVDTVTPVYLSAPVSARYVKLSLDAASDKPSFWEIQVIGH